eukprot:TRINITY_DN8196_c1_g2_i1.p1 TRINITY_DN8196_c1_g2~~TRINITY_DN8196_c1_g2_i1.p1  ORF type:complete len:486 (+),score=63.09 TRINITY_DN8196_c1_g2_i1:36-1493(+)
MYQISQLHPHSQNSGKFIHRHRQNGRRSKLLQVGGKTHNVTVCGEQLGDRASKKIAIFVEPSPFSHVSGMKNRFQQLIKHLREEGDDVTVFTPDQAPPKQFCGARVVGLFGIPLPFYNCPTLLLSLGVGLNVIQQLIVNRPDIIHVSTPGIVVFAAMLYARLLSVPLVVSYHTHIPKYIPQYTWKALAKPLQYGMWLVIRFCTSMADLTLVTSLAMKKELAKNKCRAKKIEVWQRGVDTQEFNPKYRCQEMRNKMTDGYPEAPLLVYVGRLGAEKNLAALSKVLDAIPNARLALVGDGPVREELEKHFERYPVKFMGLLKGEELSKAYASADIFMMPSESETLGFVVLEAMASGVPVVAVAAGGITDILNQHGVTGMLYKSGDYKQAIELTRQLIEDKELRNRIGAGGRLEVEKWGWKAATKRLRNLQYARAIKFRKACRRLAAFAQKIALLRLFKIIVGSILSVFIAMARALGLAPQKSPAQAN